MIFEEVPNRHSFAGSALLVEPMPASLAFGAKGDPLFSEMCYVVVNMNVRLNFAMIED